VSEEPRYTKEEWKQIERNKGLVRAVDIALTGRRIIDAGTLIEVLNLIRIISEVPFSFEVVK